jgi:hypothetical protein
MGKTPEKSSEPELVPQPHGGALQRGNPGNKGGGRPPDEFKAKMRELASNDEVLSYLEQCLKGEHGAKAAVSAHKHITERGYGKVPQEITGEGGGPLEVAITRKVVQAGADG